MLKVMTKLIQLTLIGMMIVPMSLNAQQDAKCFVNQYKKQDGITVISIGKPVMKMVGFFAKVGGMADKEEMQMLRCVDAVQVLSIDRGGKHRSDKFNSEALAFCNANRYEELIEVVDSKDMVKIFCKTEGETITDLLILNHSRQGTSSAMICISGKFTLDDLRQVSGNFGKNNNAFVTFN